MRTRIISASVTLMAAAALFGWLATSNLLSPGSQAQDKPKPSAAPAVVVKLTASDSHNLPVRYAGFNTPIALDIPYEDPRFRPLMRDAHTAVVRFPGGTIANYWDWKTGRFTPPPGLQGTFKSMAANALNFHPQGATLEDLTVSPRRWTPTWCWS